MYVYIYTIYKYKNNTEIFNLKKNKKKTNNKKNICPKLGLNQRPLAFQANALPLSYSNYKKIEKYDIFITK